MIGYKEHWNVLLELIETRVKEEERKEEINVRQAELR